MKTVKHDAVRPMAPDIAWATGAAPVAVNGPRTKPPAMLKAMVMSIAIRPQPNILNTDPLESRQASLMPSMGPKPSKIARLMKMRRISM